MIKRWHSGERRPAGDGVKVATTSSPASCIRRPAPALSCSSRSLVLMTQATAVRAHIDLGADDIEAEATRLVGLGAQRLGPGRGWIVLRDPVGMVFCVTGNSPDNP